MKKPSKVQSNMSLEDVRNWRKLSQDDLGKMIGTSQQRISHLETGYRTPSLTTLKKLSKALDCYINIAPDGEVRYQPVISRETIFLPEDAKD